MSYFIAVEVAVTDENGDAVSSVNRTYELADLSGVAASVDHAGRSLAMLCEGVEKVGLTETVDRP